MGHDCESVKLFVLTSPDMSRRSAPRRSHSSHAFVAANLSKSSCLYPQAGEANSAIASERIINFFIVCSCYIVNSFGIHYSSIHYYRTQKDWGIVGGGLPTGAVPEQDKILCNLSGGDEPDNY